MIRDIIIVVFVGCGISPPRWSAHRRKWELREKGGDPLVSYDTDGWMKARETAKVLPNSVHSTLELVSWSQ